MKSLVLISAILIVEAASTLQKSNYGYYGFQNYQQPRPQAQSRAPTVEIQQVTAEWVCNNYVTGEVKFFGVQDVVTTRLSSNDVERLLKQGVPNTNANVYPNKNVYPNTNVYPNQNTNTNANANANANANVGVNPPMKINPSNPFLRPNPVPPTEPPNIDGIGIIEARIGE